MADATKKQFGLVLRGKGAASTAKSAAPYAQRTIQANIFDDDSDASSSGGEEGKKASDQGGFARVRTQQMRQSAQTRMVHDEALAEDPSIFDYDAHVDAMDVKKEAAAKVKKESEKDRKPKYMVKLIEAAKRRELEQTARDDREQQRERAEEGELFADKEVFVTGAYKRQMEEMDKYRKDQDHVDRIDSANAVVKQGGMSGFYRYMLNELTEDRSLPVRTDQAAPGEEVKPKLDEEELRPHKMRPYEAPKHFDYEDDMEVDLKEEKEKTAKFSVHVEKKERHTRRRRDSGEENIDDDGEKKVASKKNDSRRRSSRSPTPEMKATVTDIEAARRARILQRVHRRRSTSASPEPEMAVKGAKQEKGKHARETSPKPKRARRDDEGEAEDKDKEGSPPRREPRARTPTYEEKRAARLVALKKVIARRNTEEMIEAARKMFFERHADVGVAIPV